MKEIKIKKNSFNSVESLSSNCRCICSCNCDGDQEVYVFGRNHSDNSTYNRAYDNNISPD